MRLILTILLIGLFKADAQMVINASAPYRPFVLQAPLDEYSGAELAFSLRKLRTAYTGNAIRIRKDTTGQPEQDIGFTTNGDLDTTALKNFLNARSGFIVTWYDQSTGGFNATQATQAQQPRIANLGVIERQGNRPSILFDGSNDFLGFSNKSVGNITSLYIVQKRISNAVISPLLSGSAFGASSALFAQWSDNNIYWQYFVSGAGRYRTATDNTADFVLMEAYNNTTPNQKIYKNNIELSLGTQINFTPISTNWNCIGRYSNNNWSNGKMSEVILYNTDQLSNRNAISNNINTYYSIY